MSSREIIRVRSGSLCEASRNASVASCKLTPSISNKILPGRTTATQWSGAPLPLPMRVSAGFLVTGLSGNRRNQIFPPRLIKRLMATRLASIWRSVMYPGSSTLRPKSPNASVEPRHDLPRRRPRCCLRYLTFFGINIKISQRLLKNALLHLRLALLGRQDLATVDPRLDSDDAIGGARFGEAIVNVGAQGMQWQTALQIPLRAGNLVAVQAARDADFDPFAAETQ